MWGSFNARRAWLVASGALILAMCVVILSPVTAGGAGAAGVDPKGAAPVIRGYPVVLASGAAGGVWYGGATDATDGGAGHAPEYVERVDYITPADAFLDFEFPSGLAERYPRYFAPGANGGEWFLADKAGEPEPTPLLGEVSPLGTISVEPLAVNPKSEIRGLAMGVDGDLWTTATRLRGHTRISAILRVRPTGGVTAFSKGLRKGADPANITAGPDDAMWFTDTAGRIGRIDMDGAIREFPIGRRILSDGRPPFEPSRPIVASPEGDLWFIAGPETIGRMSPSGHVRFFNPHSSYRGTEALGDKGELVGLATGPEGDIWFTRDSGEVARIDVAGHVRTVTNRLVNAYGIAFGAGGTAWVGEGPRYILGLDRREGELPARVARIGASGQVKQYPSLPECRVPRLLGEEADFAEGALGGRLVPECERLQLGHVTIRHLHSRGPLIVVSQTPRAGTPTVGYRSVKITVAPAPPLPKSCRAPAFYKLLVHASGLLLWKIKRAGTGENPEEEPTETYYACTPPTGRKRVVANVGQYPLGGSSIDKLTSAGSFVGLTENVGGQYQSTENLKVDDVLTGRTFEIIVSSSTGGSVGPEDLPELFKLGAPVGQGAQPLVLNSGGDVAWVGETEKSSTQPAQFVLYLHDQHGTRKVAVGPQITGLAFRGSLLTWQSIGTAESAPA